MGKNLPDPDIIIGAGHGTHFTMLTAKYVRKGKTIVLITHDTDLIKGYADIAYWLKDGKVSKVTKGSMCN